MLTPHQAMIRFRHYGGFSYMQKLADRQLWTNEEKKTMIHIYIKHKDTLENMFDTEYYSLETKISHRGSVKLAIIKMMAVLRERIQCGIILAEIHQIVLDFLKTKRKSILGADIKPKNIETFRACRCYRHEPICCGQVCYLSNILPFEDAGFDGVGEQLVKKVLKHNPGLSVRKNRRVSRTRWFSVLSVAFDKLESRRYDHVLSSVVSMFEEYDKKYEVKQAVRHFVDVNYKKFRSMVYFSGIRSKKTMISMIMRVVPESFIESLIASDYRPLFLTIETLDSIFDNEVMRILPEIFNDLMDNCPICYESMSLGIIVTNCNHAFHTGCLNIWKTRNNNCPMCRTRLVSDFEFNPPPIIEDVSLELVDSDISDDNNLLDIDYDDIYDTYQSYVSSRWAW